ncbi:protein of unknown function (plasmid) [Denitratisoma oestradiolicum]|uniref:Uncharacterized protein n=1 Tax=Denitratisoma oestradiolicum TaxID=311182 RepID=A0A6S6Y1Q3_9PROT|nr:protein of unknown function [Denitratisoma oestradiolicum]
MVGAITGGDALTGVDWVIVGGESGFGARADSARMDRQPTA